MNKSEAIERLRELVKPGDTIYTSLEHVSRSGMSRWIDAYIMIDNEPRRINRLVMYVFEQKIGRNHDGVYMGGCGMDMGFSLVYNLSYYLYPDGFTCTGEKCPSNDHSNGDRDYTPHHHNSGGYALRHRWM